MKNTITLVHAMLFVWAMGCATASADTILLSNGQPVTGRIIQTNGDDALILQPFEAFDYSYASIKEVRPEPASAEPSTTNRLPGFETAILSLSGQPWATNLTPIPATVIDTGILKNVPYSSFHCGSDYEVNVYGDLQNPAGLEIGVYRKLLNDDSAKANCFNFINGLLTQPADQAILRKLDWGKDLKARNGLTFEITPPTADDAYGGWWISVYSEDKLNLARASDADMKRIAITQADIAKDTQQADYSSWSADDLKNARHSQPATITFTDSSGTIISNATVVRVNDGVSLVWEKDGGNAVGLIKLEDLPESLRARFGYDERKSRAADESAEQNKEDWQQEVAAARQADAAPAAAQADSSDYYDSALSTGGYSSGGMVYVHGYYRSNGTYVHPYYRSYPRR